MTRIEIHETIDAPPERVFALMTDLARLPQTVAGITAVEVLTPGPVRKGTRFRETRVMFGRPATEEMEVVAFDPPRGWTLGATSCGTEWRTETRLVPDGARTRVELETTCRAVSLFAKLMSVFAGLMTGAMRKCIAADIADLKRTAETT